jgi:hypothetical protein
MKRSDGSDWIVIAISNYQHKDADEVMDNNVDFVLRFSENESFALKVEPEDDNGLKKVILLLRLQECVADVVGAVFYNDVIRFGKSLYALLDSLQGSAALSLRTSFIQVKVNKRGVLEWNVSVKERWASIFDGSDRRTWSLNATLLNDSTYRPDIAKQLVRLIKGLGGDPAHLHTF